MKIALLFLFIGLTSLFYSKMPADVPYPPIFSKKFPLSTPISFWASMLGMRRLAANITWIQFLQYYGQPKIEFPKFLSYVEQTVRIDPLFIHAYLMGATVLGWNLKRYDEALQFLSEGIASIENLIERFQILDITEPDERHILIVGSGPYLKEVKWKLYQLKIILVFLHNEKFEEALPFLENIALRENIPEEIKVVLAQIYKTNKFYRKSLTLWEYIYQMTNRERRRKSAKNHIKELQEIILRKNL